MTTMTDGWNAYKQAVYGGELHPQQDRECHQAFFAGALSVVKKIAEAHSLPSEEEAERELIKITDEIMAVCAARAMNLGAQN